MFSWRFQRDSTILVGDILELTLIFKIAAVGILVAVINQLLQKAGKEEYTLIITIAGLIIALMMFLPALVELKDELSSVIQF